MSDFARHAFEVLLQFGTLGLFILSVLDSSFLFLPIGNDLLVIALVAQHQGNLFLYVAAAAVGSALGVWTVDVLSRKMGEEGLSMLASKKRLDYLKKKMKQNAAIAIVVACLAPPPFPFTAVIAAASALQYPRLRLFAWVTGARFGRFLAVGLATIYFHDAIIRIGQSNEFIWTMEGFTALCVIGSVWSVIRWIQLSRSRSGRRSK